MLIEFVGSPCSGKTTTAVQTFERQKVSGVPAEFITELAREFIIGLKVSSNILPSTKISLKDNHNLQIMSLQLEKEALYKKGCPTQTLVITDSSPFNSLLYLKERSAVSETLTQRAVLLKPLIFWSRSVHGSIPDSNRIHTAEESNRLDQETLPKLVEKLLSLGLKVIELEGSREERACKAMWSIFDLMGSGGY